MSEEAKKLREPKAVLTRDRAPEKGTGELPQSEDDPGCKWSKCVDDSCRNPLENRMILEYLVFLRCR